MKRFLKTWVWSLAFAGAGLLTISVGGVSAQTTDPAAVLEAFRATLGNDVEGGLALITDDAVVSIVPPPPNTPGGVWTGKEQIRRFLEFSVMQSASNERIGNARVEGDRVTITAMVTVNDFRKWGIGAVEHTFEAVVQGGKIKTYTSTMAPSERARVAAAAQSFQATQPSGMPRTGGGEQSVVFLLASLLGILAAAAGLHLRRGISTKKA